MMALLVAVVASARRKNDVAQAVDVPGAGGACKQGAMLVPVSGRII